MGAQIKSLEFHFLNGVHNKFTNTSIMFISKHCRKLQTIAVHGHESLTEKSLEYLSEGCKHLERVNLFYFIEWNFRMTDGRLTSA